MTSYWQMGTSLPTTLPRASYDVRPIGKWEPVYQPLCQRHRMTSYWQMGTSLPTTLPRASYDVRHIGKWEPVYQPLYQGTSYDVP